MKGLWRVHTPPHPITAHTAAHTAKHGAFPSPVTAGRCAVSEIATERTAGEPRLPAKSGGRGLAASRPRWAAQPGHCRFRSCERFSPAAPTFVPTVSSPAPAAAPVFPETAVRSRAGSCRSAVDRTPPSSVPAPPARLR